MLKTLISVSAYDAKQVFVCFYQISASVPWDCINTPLSGLITRERILLRGVLLLQGHSLYKWGYIEDSKIQVPAGCQHQHLPTSLYLHVCWHSVRIFGSDCFLLGWDMCWQLLIYQSIWLWSFRTLPFDARHYVRIPVQNKP